jgi:type I restriction enzyme S subunit
MLGVNGDYTMKWEMVNIPDVLFFQEGPGVRNTQFTKKGVKLLNVGNINYGNLNLNATNIYISEEEAYGKYKHFLADDGDLIIASSGIVVDNFHNKISWVNKEHLPLCMNTSTIRFKSLNPNILSLKFFSYFLKTHYFKNQLSKLITGSAQLNFGPSHLKQIQIPLPPLTVQKEIAEILDTADALRKKDNELLKKYDELAQSIFIEMFGDLTDSKYDKSILTELTDIANGVTKNTKTENSDMITAPYLRVANVQDGFLDLSEIKYIRVSKTDFEKYQLEENDTLLTEGGDPDKLGRGTTWKNEVKHCIFQNHLFRVRIKSKEIIRPFYLSKLISSSYGKKYFLKAAKQTTGIATINSTQLKHFPVIIPPLQTQIDFENICLKIDEIKILGNSALTHTNNLFHSLLQKAFKGELT